MKEEHLIKELALAEVQSYDVGKLNRWKGYAKKYPDQKSAEGERIPTLQEVIDLVKRTGGKTQLFIELKFSPLKPGETKSREQISNVVAQILKDEGMVERVTAISFDWQILMYFQKIMLQVPTGYVIGTKRGRDTVQKNEAGASPWMGGIGIDNFDSIPEAIKHAGGAYWLSNYYHATGHKKNLSSSIIEKAHDKGLEVIAWTPDSKSWMEKLMKRAIDGIITNRPDNLLSLLKR